MGCDGPNTLRSSPYATLVPGGSWRQARPAPALFCPFGSKGHAL
jgi:hypothetical protein